jgi:hypothetical protein
MAPENVGFPAPAILHNQIICPIRTGCHNNSSSQLAVFKSLQNSAKQRFTTQWQHHFTR